MVTAAGAITGIGVRRVHLKRPGSMVMHNVCYIHFMYPRMADLLPFRSEFPMACRARYRILALREHRDAESHHMPNSIDGFVLSCPSLNLGNAFNERVSATVKSCGPMRLSRNRNPSPTVQLRRSR